MQYTLIRGGGASDVVLCGGGGAKDVVPCVRGSEGEGLGMQGCGVHRLEGEGLKKHNNTKFPGRLRPFLPPSITEKDEQPRACP